MKMLTAYINYPNPHITAHFNPNCGNIRSHRKTNQRYIRLNTATISAELSKFQTKAYRFAADQQHNDIWLEIDFQDRDFELSVLDYIGKCLGKYYKPFQNIQPKVHC
jgi:hypothetical protein